LESDEDLFSRLEQLNEIGAALSQEKNIHRLLENILLAAKAITHAAGGTLYVLKDPDDDEGPRLEFAIMRNEALGIAMGGTTGNSIPFYPIHLRGKDGRPNNKMVAAYAALTGKTVNIADAYSQEGFDFSGTRNFDKKTGYHSKAFLTVPMKNHESEIIGVLQLINRMEPGTNEVGSFSPEDQQLAESLSSQAAIALTNRQLINQLEELFESFIALINAAIDGKSPYTGGHCQRVPVLTMMLAEAVNETHDGVLHEFRMTDKDRYELKIAGMLHDCGKVTTPEYVVDKATKLETLYDRIHEIRTRFEVLKRDAEIDCLKAVAAGGDEPKLRAALQAELRALDEEFAFVAACNEGGEFMAPEKVARLKAIAARTWQRTLDDRLGVSRDEGGRLARRPPAPLPATEFLLADKPEHVIERGAQDRMPEDNPWGFKVKVPRNLYNRGELYNLSIARGTLTEEERYKINDHMAQTIMMLTKLPFPKHLKSVPELAGGHHEKMDGTGYPKRLLGGTMSVPARAMAIADIFEALTASDRPYKKAKTLSEALEIMARMKKEKHIDPDLFDVFVRKKVYLRYAEQFLHRDQIDNVDESKIPGFAP
jgi:HD-GYP domain-containing protein (c-di-GMP phosphodiesterase class II)